MRTKICGITSYEDAMMAIEAGADALGFVFYEKSPRYVSVEEAQKIIKQLPPFIEKVALFVHRTPQEINAIVKEVGATLAQIHFEADTSFYEQLDVPFIKVIRAKKKEDVLQYSDEYRLVDAYCESYGGSGKRVNVEWFDGVDCSKIILAGGLDATNVALVKKYNFFGVDVSSGVEQSYGKKDPLKVKEFIKNAH
ncbi:Phosphoribosylanthranilate isomerase [hydrothermal vent metagenome]|uniref:phosphoribosylanthranilate isomerase n=1 Tax=hydrothermal vent metagenome TaxID=652676 RepID=A0A1W1D260_9ZZZZ